MILVWFGEFWMLFWNFGWVCLILLFSAFCFCVCVIVSCDFGFLVGLLRV